jgi:hypothetical protein
LSETESGAGAEQFPTPAKDFSLFDKPLGTAKKTIEAAVDALSESPSKGYLVAVLACLTDTYRAVLVLNADKGEEHFAADSMTLVRSMLESYFSLLFWLQNPTEHSIWYWKSAWLDDRAEDRLDEELKRYEPGMQERIDARREGRGMLVRAANLSQAEICGAVTIEPWPSTPGKMIKRATKWRDESTRQQAKRLHDLLYPFMSRRAHPSWLGMGERYAYREAKKQKEKPPELLRVLDMHRSLAVFHTVLVATMIITELDVCLNSGQQEAIKNIWRTIIEFRQYAGAYYEARFEPLLGSL